MQSRKKATQHAIARNKPVKLMSVDRQMTQSAKFPSIFLIDTDADQMRHHLRESVVVVALHPNHFYFSLGIGKLSNVSQKLPMLFFQAAEIQVRENVSQQDQAVE